MADQPVHHCQTRLALGAAADQRHGDTYTFAGNWAPRLGFIIDPTGSRKTKIFANWGRFFEKIPQDMATRAMSSESSYTGVHSLLPPTAGNLIPGSSARHTPPTIWARHQSHVPDRNYCRTGTRVRPGVSQRPLHPPQLNRILEDISGITVEQAEAGVGQQFVLANPARSWTSSTTPPRAPAVPIAKPNRFHNRFGSLGRTACRTDSPILGACIKLEIVAEKRFSRNWALTANYRLAKLFGNYEGLFRNDNGQSDPNITSLFDFAASPALADQFRVGCCRPTAATSSTSTAITYSRAPQYRHRLDRLSGSPISKLLAHPAYGNAGEIPVGGRGAMGRTDVQNYFDTELEYQTAAEEREVQGEDRFRCVQPVQPQDDHGSRSIRRLSGAVPNADFGKPRNSYHRPIYARLSLRFEF